MMNPFKNSRAAQGKPTQAEVLDKTSSAAKERRLVPRPLPVPEMVEGNADSDWSLWQESVAFLDSQVQPLWSPTVSDKLDEAAPSTESAALDAFASVHKNSA